MHRCIVLMVALLLTVRPAAAAVVKEMNIEQLCAQAATIFAGVCTGTENDDPIAIRYTFAVQQCFKGTRSNTVTMRMHKTAAALARAPVFQPGQEVLLFLHPVSAQGFTSPVGFGQGTFHVMRSTDGRRMVVNERNNLRLFAGMETRRLTGTMSSRLVGAMTASGAGPIDYDAFSGLLTILTAGVK